MDDIRKRSSRPHDILKLSIWDIYIFIFLFSNPRLLAAAPIYIIYNQSARIGQLRRTSPHSPNESRNGVVLVGQAPPQRLETC